MAESGVFQGGSLVTTGGFAQSSRLIFERSNPAGEFAGLSRMLKKSER
jgi:hypothetical protein